VVIDRYRAGDGVEEIARDCQISVGALYLILHAADIALRGPARGPRKKAAAKVVRTEPRPLGPWKMPPVHYALKPIQYDPVIAITVTYQRAPYRPDALRPVYNQVRMR
jgi:hypothetical protein